MLPEQPRFERFGRPEQPNYGAMPPEQRGFGGFPGFSGGNPLGGGGSPFDMFGGGSPFDMFARMRGMGGGAPDVSNVRDSIDTDNRMMGNPQPMQQGMQQRMQQLQMERQRQMGGLGGINPYKRPQD
jgi:hypothetical protein